MQWSCPPRFISKKARCPATWLLSSAFPPSIGSFAQSRSGKKVNGADDVLDTLNSPIIEWLNDYASAGILITDADLIIRGWNRWLEQHTGREAREAIGLRLLEVFPEIKARGLH